MIEQVAVGSRRNGLRVPELTGAEQAEHALQPPSVIGMPVSQQHPLEVRAAGLVVDPLSLEEALHEDQGGALGLVVVAIDQREPLVPRTVVRLDQDRVTPPHVNQRHSETSHLSLLACRRSRALLGVGEFELRVFRENAHGFLDPALRPRPEGSGLLGRVRSRPRPLRCLEKVLLGDALDPEPVRGLEQREAKTEHVPSLRLTAAAQPRHWDPQVLDLNREARVGRSCHVGSGTSEPMTKYVTLAMSVPSRSRTASRETGIVWCGEKPSSWLGSTNGDSSGLGRSSTRPRSRPSNHASGGISTSGRSCQMWAWTHASAYERWSRFAIRPRRNGYRTVPAPAGVLVVSRSRPGVA